MTEKFSRTYDLDEIKRLIQDNKYILSQNARHGGNSLGFSDTEIIEVLLSLNPGDIYKSMTHYHNNHLWHDVYKCEREGKEIYIKFNLGSSGDDDTCIITSFKER